MTTSFEPPGPGFWEIDRSHYDGGTTSLVQAIIPEATADAYRKAWPLLGVPGETVSLRFVNGFCYTRLRPLIAPDRPSTKAPPSILIKVAARLHPEFRRRTKAARESLAFSPSPAVVDQWHAAIKPDLVAANMSFQDVPLADLSDAALVDQILHRIEHLRTTFEEHHRLHCYDLGPIGQLLASCRRWGVSGGEAVAMLAGASPSTSAPRRAAATIHDKLVAEGATPATLEEARRVSPDIDEAIGDYLHRHGGVIYSGYDLDSPTLVENPDLLLATILSSTVAELEAVERAAAEGARAATQRVRALVPPHEHDAFDELLEEARQAMDLRDDNGPITVEWPTGLLRLALLEAGRRLADRSLITQPEHVFEFEEGELATMFSTPPSSQTLAARASARMKLKRLDPPPTLGQAEPAPPLDALPEPLAQMVGTVQLVLEELGMATAPDASEAPAPGALDGTGIGQTVITGRARVAATAEEAFDVIEDGDILVTRATSPAFNLVLGLVGGLVTSEGGPMSHAAVLSRELGLSAVIGASGAMSEIATGDLLEVDPAAGRVRKIEAVRQ